MMPESALPRLDLHVHTHASKDAAGSVQEIAEAAIKKGLHGFAITDHDTVGAHAEIRAAMKDTGLLIIPGIEVTSAEGHILAIGATKPVPKGLSADATAGLIDAQGGVAVAAHPLRLMTGIGPSGLARRYKDGSILAAEAQNARERKLVTKNTDRVLRELGMSMTGGSDAHWIHDVGNAYTVFDEPILSTADVVDAIRRGRCRGAGITTARPLVAWHRARLAGRFVKRLF